MFCCQCLALLALAAVSCSLSYQFGPSRIYGRTIGVRNSYKHTKLNGIDVSNLPSSTDNIDWSIISDNSGIITSSSSLLQLQASAAIGVGIGYFLLINKPKGSAKTDLVYITRSQLIQSSGKNRVLGVVAKTFIPKGTVIGTYPGYPKKLEEALASKNSEKAKKDAQKYMWEVESGVVLDPTNSDGNIELELNYLFGIIKVPTVLARVNEPPSGYDCNLYTKINDGNIEFITEKDIFADEELFVDYGPRFDRDDYTKDAKQQAAQLAAKRRMEEEEMMTLQPIDANENKVGMIDDNTNLNDGFINNLRKKGMSRLEKEGILSPEAAAKKFSELGIGMFTPMGDEDQDLIDAMKGKTSSKPSKENSSGKSAADLLDSDEYRSFLKSTVGDDIDMFQSFMEGDSGSNKAVASEKTKLSSADEDMEMIERMRKKLQEPEPTKKEEVTSPITKNQPVTGTSNAKDSSKSQAAETYLSVEEGLELQRKLDSMTDEQVEAVFEKMRKSFGEKLQSELQTKIEQNKTVKGKKDLPKARPLDPTVREKYDDELSQIEAELEKLYENPLGVWKDIMQNPDDYAPNKNDDQI